MSDKKKNSAPVSEKERADKKIMSSFTRLSSCIRVGSIVVASSIFLGFKSDNPLMASGAIPGVAVPVLYSRRAMHNAGKAVDDFAQALGLDPENAHRQQDIRISGGKLLIDETLTHEDTLPENSAVNNGTALGLGLITAAAVPYAFDQMGSNALSKSVVMSSTAVAVAANLYLTSPKLLAGPHLRQVANLAGPESVTA